jgi:hypothetical protein
MSYETHVTMAINCITTSVYIYAVLELVSTCLIMISLTAKNVPPTDCLSTLFNVWFGVVTFGLVVAVRSLICALCFPDVTKEKITQPISAIFAHKDGMGFRFTQHEDNDKTDRLVCCISKIIFDEQSKSTNAPSDQSTAATTQAAQPPKSPGTPDSERSQAETEGSYDAKMAKGGDINDEIKQTF